MLPEGTPDITTIAMAQQRIATTIVRTPLKRSFDLTRVVGRDVFLKLETMQHTGAFKLRGAANAFLSLDDQVRARGVVTYSTGNHGRALAYVASNAGMRCAVWLSRQVPQAKKDRLEALGAELHVLGADQDEAMGHAFDMVAREGLPLIDPFDNPAVIAGQGTVGLEVYQDLPDVGTVLVPLSGGGLFSGVALALRALRPEVRLVAVSSDRCPAMRESVAAGRPVAVTEQPSLADSLGGGIGSNNRYTLAIVSALADEHVTVTDTQVADAMRHAFHTERLVTEGAGAATMAALLYHHRGHWPGPIAALVTGDNVDPADFLKIVQ